MRQPGDNDHVRSGTEAAGWPTSAPEAQGVDSRRLLRALYAIQDRGLHLHSVQVVRGGHLILDVSFLPYRSLWRHELASVTKSFTSTLIGIAIDRGLIPGVQTRLLDLLPGRVVGHLDQRKRSITLAHLLTMSSGLECIAEPRELTLERMWYSPDWAQYVLDLPMTDVPGTSFKYSSCGAHLLWRFSPRRRNGAPASSPGSTCLARWAFRRRPGPLTLWGRNFGWGDLYLTPYDMARLGHLFLRQGRWDGQPIVSERWVKDATAAHIAVDESKRPLSGYGYQWWASAEGAFAAVGRGGQRILVAPASDLVIVATAALPRHLLRELDHVLWNEIVPAARSHTALPEDREAEEMLLARVRALAEPPDDPRAPMPDMYLLPGAAWDKRLDPVPGAHAGETGHEA